MSRAVCFVIMPFGVKPDASGRAIDFDAVFRDIIAPAVKHAGFDVVRADQEMGSGLIHKAMFERLLLSEYAIADLTIPNANVYYELGVRHAVRPQSTVLLSAEASRLPFDVGNLQAWPYALDAAGRPANAAKDSRELGRQLEYAKIHDEPDSPLFKLLDGFKPPEVAHEKTDLFRREIIRSRAVREQLLQAKDAGLPALDTMRDDLGEIAAVEAGLVVSIYLAYRDVKAWDRMIDLHKRMDPVLAHTILVREQHAFALNRAGRGGEAERVLLDLIKERGGQSETYGLLGRIYKDRWRAAKAAKDAFSARGFLDKAVEAYRRGFESDSRDAFPGINAATLMEIARPGDPAVKDLVPVVRYAAERKIARGAGDYWDHATLLELAVLERDEARTGVALSHAMAERGGIDSWAPASTAANLQDIAEARRAAGEDVAGLEAVVRALEGR